MIEQEIINAVKQTVDITSLIRSKGIELTKKGKGFMGLCPFHDDHNPSLSVNPDTNLWQCFACGAGGDVIRFTEMFDKLTFPQAVKSLTGTQTPKLKRTSNKKEALSLRNQRLLERVMGYYQNTFNEDPRGRAYLKEERGIIENSSLRDFGTGFVNGSLVNILPEDPETIQSLKQIGILNRRGNEVFTNCVVFPILDRRGSVVSLYGRRIDNKKNIKHMYLPGPRAGLINRQAVKRSDTLFLTESIIDALSLYDQGFKNVIPLYGVNGLTEHHLFLFNGAVKGVYLVFDADEAGQKAVQTVGMRLKEKGIDSWQVTLPEKDVNDYFKTHTAGEFEQLLKSANKGVSVLSEMTLAQKQTLFKKTENGFVVGYGERQYQVKSIKREKTKLRITIKASIDVMGNAPFELSTIDLYSSRSRSFFAGICKTLFDAKPDLIKEDLNRILTLVENQGSEEEKEETDTETVSEEDRKRALQFLENPDMFDEILTDLETIGITGEETNKLVSYLTAVSRKLEDPLSALVQSRSAAGKSTLQDAILSLVPEEDYVKYTRITDQALFYKDEDSLVHKILAIEEEVGMGGAAYSIRNIQSSKKITVAATGKDPGSGKMRTEEYTVKGPVSVMVTTTSADLEGETASRFMLLAIDESSDMTEAIHKKQRESETLEGLIKKKKSDHIITKHHTAQRMLRPLQVVNPYSEYLSYPAGTIRTRRDHKKYLGLIRVTCYLFQYQRKIKKVKVEDTEVEYIEVTLDDIDKANRLADEVLGQCLDDLAKPSRTLLEKILELAKDLSKDTEFQLDEITFSRRMIREHTGWTDWQIRAHIKQLEDLEYIHARMGSRGKEYSYALSSHDRIDENDRHYLNLTSVKSIRKLLKTKCKIKNKT